MDKLPQELIDKIISSIDRTRPYSPSLLACSCVCRSWRRQAQKELFPRVYFVSIDRLKKWDHDISLESEIPSHIRHLLWGILPEGIGRQDPFFENIFPGRFASFSNLESLSVTTLPLGSFDNTAIERTFSRIGHSLRSLHIGNLTTDLEKWCFLISLLPNLRNLYTPAVTMLEGKGGSSQNHSLSFNFTGHIAPYNYETERFFRCVASLNPRFESLGVFEIDEDLVETFNLVVKSCSATLTTVSINLLPMRMQAVKAMTRLDLSPCSNLRVLSTAPSMAGSPELFAILRTISSKRFEKLIIGPHIERVQPYWRETDQIFRSFAERLYKLGAAKPLTMVLEFTPGTQGRNGGPGVQSVWPQFCEVGAIVEEYADLG